MVTIYIRLNKQIANVKEIENAVIKDELNCKIPGIKLTQLKLVLYKCSIICYLSRLRHVNSPSLQIALVSD